MSKFVKLINKEGNEFLFDFKSGWGVSEIDGKAQIINDEQGREIYTDMTYFELKNALIHAQLL